MTYAEILSLPAGRELDALVAEKVMGWTLHSDGWIRWVLPDGHWVQGDGCPAYSTYPAAAWLVVEHFRADPAFRWTDFAVFTSGCVATGSRDYLVDFAGGNFPGRAEGETLPLAICRAALSFVLT